MDVRAPGCTLSASGYIHVYTSAERREVECHSRKIAFWICIGEGFVEFGNDCNLPRYCDESIIK